MARLDIDVDLLSMITTGNSACRMARSEPSALAEVQTVTNRIMYCITLRNNSTTKIIGWYDGSASNFSTDQRRAKLFFDRVDADLVAYQLRRMYPRIAQDIEVSSAVQPTAIIYNVDRRNRVVVV
jgi:hypothetical protein